jgi:hypothetical protein
MVSSLCTEGMLHSPAFLAWADRIRPAWDHDRSGVPVYVHRKLWEWLFIIQALAERDMLRPGRRGIGFGVGHDPLVALFASLGCEIVASDLDIETASRLGWVESDQHSASLSDLNPHGLCDPETFAARVVFRAIDMNAIPSALGGFDFSWSACALEHLGTLERGEAFVSNQMGCLKPGGVAVHTTEFNVSSNWTTLESGPTALFRQRDVESLARRLRREGHRITIDLDPGDSLADRHVDVPPYTTTHLKVTIGEFVATSLGLIVEKRPWRSRLAGPGLARRLGRLLFDVGNHVAAAGPRAVAHDVLDTVRGRQ